MDCAILLLIFIASIGLLSFKRASLSVWTITFVLLVFFASFFTHASLGHQALVWIALLCVLLPLNLTPLRRHLISRHILSRVQQRLPKISMTEKEALAAGTVSFEAELFRGNPNWEKLFAIPASKLTEEEQAFINGPVEELCGMINDWDITQCRADLPPEIWQFLKEQGFFGLIIPKQYGGKEFSAYAHSEVLLKVYGCSVSVGTTVAVPNSLGPAELLLHYGTEEQKNYYLPRLAKGEEIPCFALTSPEAGSDAASIPDTGIICHGNFAGKEIIGIRLNWDKRYITLAPIATVLGLAFKLYDPEHLLSERTDYGITCALIPTNTPGITIGRRHFPLNAVFQNGPTQGKDVFIPLDWIIGGMAMAGHGWKMLMECLAAGRAISLPTSAVGGAKLASLASSAYARIRKQFNNPIGYFEGVEEALTRIVANTYLIDSGRLLTLSILDQGQKPAVISGILKYHTTEIARQVANDAMDIHGGKGICLGPKNYIGRSYQSVPISITVEGANILTRSLIIFGQGAIRCHPYILAEFEAVQLSDPKQSLKKFDKVLFGHFGYTLSNLVRSLFFAISNGRGIRIKQKATKRYLQQFTRYSASLALMADMSLILLGGGLKRKEKLSARLGDILSLLYLGSAVLKRFADDGEPTDDLPVVDWVCQTVLQQIIQRFDEVLANYPRRLVAKLLTVFIFPFGKPSINPCDNLGHRIAELVLTPSATRDRISRGIYTKDSQSNPIGHLEYAFAKLMAIEPLEKRLSALLREGKIQSKDFVTQVSESIALGAMNQEEAQQLLAVDKLRKEIIAVDDFAAEELAHK